MGGRRTRTAAVFVSTMAIALTAAASPAAASKATPRETVCHAGDDGIAALSLPTPAAEAHRRHGDAVPGDAVPGREGHVYDENCEAILVAVDTDGDGIADLDESIVCVSVDGVVVHRVGTASCRSSVGGFAYAEGPGSNAIAEGGSGNRSVAVGVGAMAIVGLGNDNTAIAFGDDASAQAGVGDRNTAEALGAEASAIAAFGDDNVARADGMGTFAYAASPTGCTAVTSASMPTAFCD